MPSKFVRNRARSPQVLLTQIALVIAVCGLLTGLPSLLMREETEIARYAAPKEFFPKLPEKLPTPGEPARLWGAIVPLQSDVWFFKLTGPIDEVRALETELREFLKSVQFGHGEPTWTLPSRWNAQPADGFRFATLQIPSSTAKPLELAVSKLARAGELNEQLLANLNRWRGQMTLPPWQLADMSRSVEAIEVAGVNATVINVVGFKQPETMGRGPLRQ